MIIVSKSPLKNDSFDQAYNPIVHLKALDLDNTFREKVDPLIEDLDNHFKEVKKIDCEKWKEIKENKPFQIVKIIIISSFIFLSIASLVFFPLFLGISPFLPLVISAVIGFILGIHYGCCSTIKSKLDIEEDYERKILNHFSQKTSNDLYRKVMKVQTLLENEVIVKENQLFEEKDLEEQKEQIKLIQKRLAFLDVIKELVNKSYFYNDKVEQMTKVYLQNTAKKTL